MLLYIGLTALVGLAAFVVYLKRAKRVVMIGGDRSYVRFTPNPGIKVYVGKDFYYLCAHRGFIKGR
jgi:hypothetical protein